MLRDILRECRCTLDYHSNESVLMSFNWLRLADKRRAISAPCRGVVPKKKNSGSLHKMAKQEEKWCFFVVQWFVA